MYFDFKTEFNLDPNPKKMNSGIRFRLKMSRNRQIGWNSTECRCPVCTINPTVVGHGDGHTGDECRVGPVEGHKMREDHGAESGPEQARVEPDQQGLLAPASKDAQQAHQEGHWACKKTI